MMEDDLMEAMAECLRRKGCKNVEWQCGGLWFEEDGKTYSVSLNVEECGDASTSD